MENKQGAKNISIGVSILIKILCLLICARCYYYWQIISVSALMGRAVWLYVFKILVVADMGVMVSAIYFLRPASGKRLVASGIYGWVAHPAYVTYLIVDLIFWVGAGGCLDNYDLVSRLGFWMIIPVTAYCEEIQLISLVGDEALQYYRRTLSWHWFISRLKP